MKKRRSNRVTANGERIKSLVGQKGLYLDYLAKQAGISERTLDKALAGETVEIATLEAVAIALGEPYGSLVLTEETSETSASNAVAIFEDESNYLTIKARINIDVRFPKGESPPPKLRTILELLKAILPDNEDIRLLSVGAGGIVFIACQASKANVSALGDSAFIDELHHFGVERFSFGKAKAVPSVSQFQMAANQEVQSSDRQPSGRRASPSEMTREAMYEASIQGGIDAATKRPSFKDSSLGDKIFVIKFLRRINEQWFIKSADAIRDAKERNASAEEVTEMIAKNVHEYMTSDPAFKNDPLSFDEILNAVKQIDESAIKDYAHSVIERYKS